MKKVMSLLLCLLMLAALPISANAMRVQHNIMALNSHRNYTNNVSALSKNLEKLSSGYRVKRAGDDAAGLAISEKMRAQISALGGTGARYADNEKSVLSCIWALLDAEGEWHYMDKEDGQILDQDALEEVLELAKMQIFSGLYGQNNTPQGMFSGVCTSNSVNGIGYEADAEGKLNAVYQIVVTTDLQIIVNDNPLCALVNTQGDVAFYGAGVVNIGVFDGAGNVVDSFSVQVNEDATLETASYANQITMQLGDTGSFQTITWKKANPVEDQKESTSDIQIAKEMLQYTKNNILVSAANAMLAQANQIPQGVLQMLQ